MPAMVRPCAAFRGEQSRGASGMVRRAAWFIVCASLGVTALPGCGPAFKNLLQPDARPQTPQVGGSQQARTGLYPRMEEAEPTVSPPPRPTGNRTTDQITTLPPGQHLPEFTGPPQVLPPRGTS